MTRAAGFFLKLRQLFRSDLAWFDRALYLLDQARDRCTGIPGTGVRRYRLRGGGAVFLRRGSTDRKVFDEVFLEQIYAPSLDLLPANGVPMVLVDLGANIGLSTIFLARRMNLTRIVAVEPCPENFRMLVENTLENTCGLAGRCTVVQAFAGAERGFANLVDAGFGAWGMRMGAASRWGTPVLPLVEIVPEGSRVVLKCDIEGSERHLFRTLGAWENMVDFIILELHTEFFTTAELNRCLEESGYHWIRHGTLPRGALLAVIGLERARRKTAARYNRGDDSRDTSRGAAAM